MISGDKTITQQLHKKPRRKPPIGAQNQKELNEHS